MNIVKAIVKTNSEDDPYMRVRVSSPNTWPDESELLPSINSIYLEKGDVVLVIYETLSNATILGKYNSFEQSNPVEGQVLFSAKKDNDWIIGTLISKELTIQSSAGFSVKGMFDGINIKTPDGSSVVFKDNNFSLSLKSGASLVSDGENLELTTTGGKISISNKSNNLLTLLSDLLNTLQTTLPTTQGSPAAQNFNPTIIAKFAEVKTKLGLLLK